MIKLDKEIDLEKAAAICAEVASHRARWGKHGGFGSYSSDDVLDALVDAHAAGLFDLSGEKEARVKANRRAAAAEARATKAQKRIDYLEKELAKRQSDE